MKNPKFSSLSNDSIFNLMRVLRLAGILLLAAGAVFPYRGEVQASPMGTPVRQTEEVVQFRGRPDSHPGWENEYTQVTDLLYPQLLLSFDNNSVSGYSNVQTSFSFDGLDWTAEGFFDLSGTYDPETGVVAGRYDKTFIFRHTPRPGYGNTGSDVHYYGTFRSYYADPEAKFSLADAKLDLYFEGFTASDTYYTDKPVFHHDSQSGFLVNFVREGTDPTDCAASVYGLDPLVPGDVISPGASYTNQDGADVDIIQERWFINGQEATSVVWNGYTTTVELQWTCLGHQGHSQTFEIAAYQAPPVPTEPNPGDPENADPPEVGPGLAELISGLGYGMIGLGGVAGLVGLLGLGIPIIKGITAAPVAAAMPPVQAPVSPADNPPAGTPTPRRGKLDPSLKKPWELKINDLIDKRTNIQEKILSTNQQIEKLTRLYKNNILKVSVKGGLETGQILLDGVSGGAAAVPNIAIEIGKKTLGDKASDAVFQKHDSSQDGKNVVDLKNLIDDLKALRDGLRNQVKDINHEIKGIQEHIRNEF